MHILQVHNHYQLPGGEDLVVADEANLLRRSGHTVETLTASNETIGSRWSLPSLLRAAWNRVTFRRVLDVIGRHRPAVVHIHNLFGVLSPSVVAAARRARVPVVMTLHNYRLICPGGTLFDGTARCERCFGGRMAREAVLRKCYRQSRLQTTGMVMILGLHRVLGTWTRPGIVFLAPSVVAREKLLQAGMPGQRIMVHGGFLLDDPGSGLAVREGAVSIGRFTREKGMDFIVRSWESLLDIPLVAMGDGPLRSWVEGYIAGKNMRHVSLPGPVSRGDVLAGLKSARVLVAAPLCLETFGRVVMEAFACGTPAVVPSGSALAELVVPGVSGGTFISGDKADFVKKVREVYQDEFRAVRLGQKARQTFVERCSASAALERLLSAYAKAAETVDDKRTYT